MHNDNSQQYYQDLKEYNANKRIRRLEKAEKLKPKFKSLPFTFVEHTQFHWGFYNKKGIKLIDYFPGTSKMIHHGRSRYIGSSGLLNFLKRQVSYQEGGRDGCFE